MDPIKTGVEDPDHPGIFDARVPGTSGGVTYVPNPDTPQIGIADISSRD